jgi:hypothetical protein
MYIPVIKHHVMKACNRHGSEVLCILDPRLDRSECSGSYASHFNPTGYSELSMGLNIHPFEYHKLLDKHNSTGTNAQLNALSIYFLSCICNKVS